MIALRQICYINSSGEQLSRYHLVPHITYVHHSAESALQQFHDPTSHNVRVARAKVKLVTPRLKTP